MAELNEIIEELLDKRMREMVDHICGSHGIKQHVKDALRPVIIEAVKKRMPLILEQVKEQLLTAKIEVRLFGEAVHISLKQE